MAIEILPITPADIPEMVSLGRLAFADDPFFNSTIPADVTPEQLSEMREWRIALSALRLSKSNARYFKAVDQESQRMAGFSGWTAPTTETDSERWPGRPEWMIGVDEQLGYFKTMREQVLGARTDVWFLQSMCVHPDFQGRGIAGQLLDVGIDIIDKEDLECYLEATPRGFRVYEKAGFVDKLSIPVLDGTYVLHAMLRPAKSASK